MDTFELADNVLKIKYATDGTQLTSKIFLVVSSFSILNQGRLINSTMHNYTHALYLMDEDTENLHKYMKSTVDIISKLN